MMETLPYNDQLKESPLLRDLDDQELRVVFEHMEHVCFDTGQLILKQGSPNVGLWLLGEGCCEVTRIHADGGKKQILAMLGPGTVFGEMSFFQQANHSASVQTMSQVTVHQLTHSAFADLQKNACQTTAKILRNLVRVLSERLQLMDHWVCELVDQPAQQTEKRDEWREFRAKLYTEWDFS